MALRSLARFSCSNFLFALLLILAPSLRADSITIGQLTFAGASGLPPGMSHFYFHLYPGVTFDPLLPGMPYPLTFTGVLAVDYGAGWDTAYAGIFPPIPDNGGLLPPNGAIICPCTRAQLTMTLEPYLPATFLLANGTPFTMNRQVVVKLLPPSGQTFLQDGQTAQILATPVVPEPATLFLMGTGLVTVWGVARIKRRHGATRVASPKIKKP